MAGCHAVICGGIGQGAANALAANGIEAVLLAGPASVEEAATARRPAILESDEPRAL
jgi:predicted Fe-Mo cluster-binding NifX family protein